MTKNAKIERSQKEFLKAMKKKFSEGTAVSTVSNPLLHDPVQHHVTLIPYVYTERK